jgi:tripartite-type tricarboxylate transporter receptor subunit TctC
MVQVPYKDFTQAINDLAEGRIQVTATSLAVVRPHVQSGKVVPLAVTSRARIRHPTCRPPPRPAFRPSRSAHSAASSAGAIEDERAKVAAIAQQVGTKPQ